MLSLDSVQEAVPLCLGEMLAAIKMKERISTKYLSETIDLLEKLNSNEIVGVYIHMPIPSDLNKRTLISENIELQTYKNSFHFFSLGCTQHWYGEYEIEILKEADQDFLKECEASGIQRAHLLSERYWDALQGKKIKKIRIFSTGHKAFNLMRLCNEKTYEQAHYIEFSGEEAVLCSIGYYGTDNVGKSILNEYSWVGDLRINLNHSIVEHELIKWDLKEIYNTSW